MKAVVFHAPFDVRLEEVARPVLQSATDAIVKVELSAICGSDLHPYRGNEIGIESGTVMGHEFLGEVVECGEGLRLLRPGSRVVAPFTTSCGVCFFCAEGLTARCEKGELFGWIEKGRGLHGGQAEYVRVPLADTTLAVVPDQTPREAALFAGDILSTGLFTADMAGVGEGSVAAVIGCGPVGLMAIVACRHRGAGKVLAIEPVPERRRLAEAFGAEALDPGGTVRSHVDDATRGRGVDCVLEMVGSPEATRLGVDLLRSGGTLAAAGVHTESEFAFSPGEAYDNNLTYRAGRCPVRSYMDEALQLAGDSELDIAGIVSDRIRLEDAVDAYRRFDRREAGCVKVLLFPGEAE
ncbi:MAG: alcohol dehydrogenase catalytic domain-containing protein [bacterium]|nr:alcohol dehydrogenase catalytic domain-containing protein [bacterium]